MEYNNSVFNRNRYTHYPWWNIVGHIKVLCSMIKAVYWRAKYGFEPYDTWCLYNYIGDLMHDMLSYLDENRYGFPGDMTDESWGNYLQEMAEAFKLAATESNLETETCLDVWIDAIAEFGKGSLEAKEAWEGLKKAEDDLEQMKLEMIKKACEMLNERFFYLWD